MPLHLCFTEAPARSLVVQDAEVSNESLGLFHGVGSHSTGRVAMDRALLLFYFPVQSLCGQPSKKLNLILIVLFASYGILRLLECIRLPLFQRQQSQPSRRAFIDGSLLPVFLQLLLE